MDYDLIAKAHGFQLGGRYKEKEVCRFLKESESTVKRKRLAGSYPHIRTSTGRIRYLGIQVARIIAGE